MKNNNFFRAGMLAALIFGMAVIGCDTGSGSGDGGETLPELPASKGNNEVGGKTYLNHDKKWEFSAGGTYRYFQDEEDNGVFTERENGNYSWDSSGAFKTLTLAPQRIALPGGTPLDKAALKAAAKAYFAAHGLTEATVAEATEGQYTTIAAFINAYVDYGFALQMCNYTVSGEAIGALVRMGPYGYGNAKGGKVVAKNDTGSTLTVKTYAGYEGTEAAYTVSAGESKQVFSGAADTFLTEIELTTTSNSITYVEIEEGPFSRRGTGSGSAVSSFETGPICVGGGRTITITVE
jgi:hypothetical protein